MRNTLFTLAAVSALIAAPSTQAAELKAGLYAEFDTTKGKILLSLEFEKTPQTVASFVGLAEGTKDFKNRPEGKPYYDGLTFHRVIANFMIQGGCPQGTGRSGPGYNFSDETRKDLSHSGPGILSMANSDPPNKRPYSNTGRSNGSQFFITHRATPHLDGKHTVFGKVVGPADQKVVDAIAKGDKLNSVKIIRVGEKAKAFKGDEAHYKKIIEDKEKAKEKAKTAKFADRMKKEAEQIKKLIAELKKKHKADVVTTESGLRYIVVQKGVGNPPAKGTTISAHYTGTLADGTKFDSSRDRGVPLKFQVGVGRVIPGWDEALLQMKKGEQRILIIPHKLAYGERGAGGSIPPFATLVFDVALVNF